MKSRLNFKVGVDDTNRTWIGSTGYKKEICDYSTTIPKSAILQASLDYLMDDMVGEQVNSFGEDIQWLLRVETHGNDVRIMWEDDFLWVYLDVLDFDSNQGLVQNYFSVFGCIVDVIENCGRGSSKGW